MVLCYGKPRKQTYLVTQNLDLGPLAIFLSQKTIRWVWGLSVCHILK